MKLVLVTGAGASRQLGADGAEMPLMFNWSTALAMALDKREQGLAEACGLHAAGDGQEFEANLGLLLAWDRAAHLQQRFIKLGCAPAFTPQAHNHTHVQQTNTRLATIKDVINDSLYDQFGLHRVDDEAARLAYTSLLATLGSPELVVATTNYDRSAEAGLEQAGVTVHTGFTNRGQRTPRLNARGMFKRRGDGTVLVIHLHGAVGWYASDGYVEDHPGDKPYKPLARRSRGALPRP